MWARLDDSILDNPKIIAVGPLGFALHVAAITWCARNLTDGFIPKRRVGQLLDLPSLQVTETTKVRVLHALTADDLATDLERLRLWHDRGETWEVHDYLHYNPSRAQVLAARETTRQRVANHRKRRKNIGNGVTNAPVTHYPVPVPVPVPEEKKLASLVKKSARDERALRASTWPDDFTLTRDRATLATEVGVEIPWEWNKFKDHHRAKGSRFVDWDAAWRTWIRNAVEFAERKVRR